MRTSDCQSHLSFFTKLESDFETPAYIFDLDELECNLQRLQLLRKIEDCHLLYSIKALPLEPVLERISHWVDGFSVSSLFEARLVNDLGILSAHSVHLTSPGIKVSEYAELAEICSHISFNSMPQSAMARSVSSSVSLGIRINPKIQSGLDERFNPCRRYSKLGVDINLFEKGLSSWVRGIHFHTMFGGKDLRFLYQSFDSIEGLIKRSPGLEWINLGGGYLYSEMENLNDLCQFISHIIRRYGLKVFLEPGKGIVGNIGYLATRIIDCFDSDNMDVLVIDSSVNQHPEIFEYQARPYLLNECERGTPVLMVGSSCLAGDIFGEYNFESMPKMQDIMVFGRVGAYSLIKANRFNGFNLPAIYLIRDSRVHKFKTYSYQDYLSLWR